MKKSRLMENQIVTILKEADSGLPVIFHAAEPLWRYHLLQ